MSKLESSPKPQVSIVITCYNYAKYIEQAIASACGQTYKNIEVIVINDGSTDNSHKLIIELQNKFIFTYIQQKNQGIVSSRNKALSLATGQYLVQLDADDYLEENYVEETLKVARLHNADIVYTDYETFGDESAKSNFPEHNIEILKNQNYINISCLLRMSAVDGYKFDDNLDGLTHEDWDFFLNLCANGRKAVKCSSTILHYRLHSAGRNNRFNDSSDRKKYIDVYSYVIDKQTKRNPEDFGYLVGRTFAHWYVAIYSDLENQKKAIGSLTGMYERMSEQKREAESALHDVVNSRKYKFAHRAGQISHPAKLISGVYRNGSDRIRNGQKFRTDTAIYSKNDEIVSLVTRKPTTRAAVVLHLFYLEMWPYFANLLDRLKGINFDLFISVPTGHTDYMSAIYERYPSANIFEVPNRGRDVLPFLWLAKHLHQLGYEYLLKLHSKKSTHRTDGKEWLSDLAEKLVPIDNNLLRDTFSILEHEKTALIGPEGHFVSLKVNYIPNKGGLNHVLARIFPKSTWQGIENSLDQYGFFAGTMFWIRLDALAPIINAGFKVHDFQEEQGQIDATMAHALERAFGVVPELVGKGVFEISKESLKKIPYDSGIIPDWSNVQNPK